MIAGYQSFTRCRYAMSMAQLSQTILVLLGAGVLGSVVGVASVATTPSGGTAVVDVAQATPDAIVDTAVEGSRAAAVATGIVRSRSPQPGDHWGGCHAARAAGTAPIYRGEPGYREDMDGDNDGIACEPVP
jgi:hypothetical protein